MDEETVGTVATEETSIGTEETSEVTETTETGTETQVEETTQATEGTTEETTEKPAAKKTELAEFQGSVSARLKDLDKRAPGLSAHLNKFPQVRDAIAATFRREAAFRELYPGGLQEA